MFPYCLAVALYGKQKILTFFGVATNILFHLSPYSYSNYEYYFRPKLIEAGDLDDDGFIDLIVGSNLDASIQDGTLVIFFNRGDMNPFGTVVPFVLPSVLAITSIVIADLDNDGKQNDFAVCSIAGQVFTYLQRNSSNQWKHSYAPEVGKYMYEFPSILIKGRFNDDELDDLAAISPRSDTLQVLLAYGNNDFTQYIYLTQSYPTSIARMNFNNDSIDDLAILGCDGTVTIFLGTKMGIFHQNDLSFKSNASTSGKCSQSLKVADLNQDGRDDIVFIDAEANSIRVFLGSNCDEQA